MLYQLGFLGAGNMAEAIARAAIDSHVLTASQMIASDPAEARRAVFTRLGIAVTSDNAAVIGQSAQVVLAVKPQMMRPVAADLARCGSPEQVIISIMAGVTIAKLSAAIAEGKGAGIVASPLAAGSVGGNAANSITPPQAEGQTSSVAKPQAVGDAKPETRIQNPAPTPHTLHPTPFPRIIRVMPNTPLMVGQGMAGIATGPDAAPGDDELAMKLFSSGGKAVRVEEALIDAITAVSGSGPAYVFYLAEAMEQAAADLGLGQHARLLVGQTLLGAATLLLNSPDTPAELRRKVTSPGGTTEAAVKHLDANQVKKVWVDAIMAAERRSKELGK